jgi:protein-S-isoprenylcysteine O-methyltransferase Ste14
MHRRNIGHLIGHVVYIALYGLLIISSIIFYNSANLVAFLYIGWITLGFGIIILLSSSLSRKRGLSESANKETLIESGLYALVRHPEFLGHMLIFSSLILISQHLINLVIGAILIVLLSFAMIEEERRNMEKFGDAYKDYMKRVPRINILIGIIRQMHGRKGNKGEIKWF